MQLLFEYNTDLFFFLHSNPVKSTLTWELLTVINLIINSMYLGIDLG